VYGEAIGEWLNGTKQNERSKAIQEILGNVNKVTYNYIHKKAAPLNLEVFTPGLLRLFTALTYSQ
jgi:hypothetical protein